MRSTLTSLPAPSAATLRFLRSQLSESSFFSCNQTALPPIKSLPINGCCRAPNSTSVRQICTSRYRRAEIVSDCPHFGRPNLTHTAICQSNILGGLSPSKSLHRPHDNSDQDIWNRQHRKPIGYPWYKRLLKRNGSRNGEKQPNIEDLHPLPSFLDDAAGTALGRSKAGKLGSEVKLRCTEIDENGNVITVNGEFKKSELIAKVGLQ